MSRGAEHSVVIRAATVDDEPFLWQMLAEAVSARPRWTVAQARSTREIAHYLEGWPRPGDLGVVAIDTGPDRSVATTQTGVGAAWLRWFSTEDPGYGFVDCDTPELTIACKAPWRSRGVGRRLLEALFDRARAAGIEQISLSVDPTNTPARHLYEAIGFLTADREAGGSIVMVRSI